MQEEFDRYKQNNEMKIAVVNEVREENKRLRSALTKIAIDDLKWGQSIIKSRERLQKIASAALEDFK
ncbi:hypothetical protein BTO30_16255 [Domibacillus antri]|uniref:Uncharacterized protein n=1 Tax=Domibacillus antri TaxID=1714264 RepID=A0A1Q8Q1L1_9BACI|nr:hypothetical protein BTO30_16255 [Domibacillus antri]